MLLQGQIFPSRLLQTVPVPNVTNTTLTAWTCGQPRFMGLSNIGSELELFRMSNLCLKQMHRKSLIQIQGTIWQC